jgi:hypothetical protein
MYAASAEVTGPADGSALLATACADAGDSAQPVNMNDAGIAAASNSASRLVRYMAVIPLPDANLLFRHLTRFRFTVQMD